MSQKFILTDETKVLCGRTLHRIKAVKDFCDVKAGDIGGWVEKEENLSQDGTCWVYDSACVFDSAKVYGCAMIQGAAKVYGSARVCDSASVYGNANVCESSWVFGRARVCDVAHISGYACIYDSAVVSDMATVYDSARVYDSAKVCGSASIYSAARVRGEARIFCNNDIIWISKIGSRYGTTTVFRNKDNGLTVSCGCFLGSLEEFAAKVEETHGDNKFGREYKAIIKLIKIYFDEEA